MRKAYARFSSKFEKFDTMVAVNALSHSVTVDLSAVPHHIQVPNSL